MIGKDVLHIWIIDDNQGDLILLQEHLVDIGFRSKNILVFNEIATFEIALKTEQPDILLLDLFLPGTYGVETIERVNGLNPNFPIVVMSGIQDVETAVKSVQLGAQDFLIKNQIANEVLDRMISYSIERYRNVIALKESNEKYSFLFHAVPIGILLLNDELEIVEANDEAKELFRTNLFVGLPYLSVVSSKSKDLNTDIESDILNSSTCMFKQVNENEIRYIEQHSSITRIGTEKGYILSVVDRTDKVNRDIKKIEIINSTLDNERLRVARELHDGIGQYLIAIKLYTEILSNNCKDEKDNIQKIKTLTSNSIDLTRTLSYNLAPPELKRGLCQGIDNLFKQLHNVNSIKFELICEDTNANPFDKNEEYAVFRIIQEFVNNSIKYSNCKLVSCSITFSADAAKITIQDDGEGFDSMNSPEGLGLRTMRERALAADIAFDFQSTIGLGTKLVMSYHKKY